MNSATVPVKVFDKVMSDHRRESRRLARWLKDEKKREANEVRAEQLHPQNFAQFQDLSQDRKVEFAAYFFGWSSRCLPAQEAIRDALASFTKDGK